MSVRFAKGEPELKKLKAGVSESKQYERTENLGDLFKKAFEGQPVKPSPRAVKNGVRRNGVDKRGTGILGLSRVRSSGYKQGYFFKFTFKDENGKKRTMQSKDLLTLYNKILDTGNNFIVIDIKKARSFLNKYCNTHDFKILFAAIIGVENESVFNDE